jgi:hypothetical protein
MKVTVDACTRRLLFCRSFSVRMENEEWIILASLALQVRVDFQDVLPGSVHAGDYSQVLLGQTAIFPYIEQCTSEAILDFCAVVATQTSTIQAMNEATLTSPSLIESPLSAHHV